MDSATLREFQNIHAANAPIDQPDDALSDDGATLRDYRRGSIDGSTLFSAGSRRNSIQSQTSLRDLTTTLENITTSSASPLSRADLKSKRAARIAMKDVMEEQRQLAMVYEDEGRNEEAIELRERLVVAWEMMSGEEDGRTLEAQRMLALLYQSNGYGEKALRLREHIAAVRDRTCEADNLQRLEAHRQLIMSRRINKREEFARELTEHLEVARAFIPEKEDQGKQTESSTTRETFAAAEIEPCERELPPAQRIIPRSDNLERPRNSLLRRIRSIFSSGSSPGSN
ncbi:unnamed protein product [Clonostachys rosea f. rosea IK726]|uniref:Uncharacterized protein n=1 Tax=Clonostachys rosea f. rosea IK726 TaxID=1349383 RepID=A0ACA9U8X7_BIOOC|nr:unnamed protein product [Clonostachys rosea f. rosea IK726]